MLQSPILSRFLSADQNIVFISSNKRQCSILLFTNVSERWIEWKEHTNYTGLDEFTSYQNILITITLSSQFRPQQRKIGTMKAKEATDQNV